MTLIELVITISLMASLVAVVAISANAIGGVDLKTAASRVAGTIRFTYDLAARKNSPFRIVFDLDEQSYWIESASEKFLLDREKADVRKGKQQAKEERERSSRFVSRSYIEGGQMWQPKARASFAAFAGPMSKKVKLPSHVVLQDVWVAHQSDTVTAGQAYLYSFPTGMTEQAVIHLGDDDQDVFTLQVEALLGRVKIHPQYVEGLDQ